MAGRNPCFPLQNQENGTGATTEGRYLLFGRRSISLGLGSKKAHEAGSPIRGWMVTE